MSTKTTITVEKYDIMMHLSTKRAVFVDKSGFIPCLSTKRAVQVEKHRSKQNRRTREKGSRVRLCVISQGLRELAGSVADHNWYFYRLMAVFLCERGLCLCDVCIVELGLDEVDGTAGEAAAHDA